MIKQRTYELYAPIAMSASPSATTTPLPELEPPAE